MKPPVALYSEFQGVVSRLLAHPTLSGDGFAVYLAMRRLRAASKRRNFAARGSTLCRMTGRRMRAVRMGVAECRALGLVVVVSQGNATTESLYALPPWAPLSGADPATAWTPQAFVDAFVDGVRCKGELVREARSAGWSKGAAELAMARAIREGLASVHSMRRSSCGRGAQVLRKVVPS